MTTRTLALVGATSGVGTTRLTVECAVTLAHTGRDVVVVDTAFATQGVAAHLDRPIGSDATALATGRTPIEETLYEYPGDLPGRLVVCPARASFEGLGDGTAAALLGHDAVLVDVPPVAANQAVEAIEAAETVALVTEDIERGETALAGQRERLVNLGRPPDGVVANRAAGGHVDADATVPESAVCAPRACSMCVSAADSVFAAAVGETVETLLEVPVESSAESRGLLSRMDGGRGSACSAPRDRRWIFFPSALRCN